jgi:hypothetical protein
MKKAFLFLLALALLAGSLSGCLAPVSLDALGYVVTVGIDRAPGGGFYFTLALQREMAEQNLESEGGASILADTGADLFEAIERIEGSVPYSLNFSRTNFIIMSRELAGEGGLSELLHTDLDSLKVRASAIVMISEESAFGFIGGMYANNDANINKLQTALLLDRMKTGMVSVVSLAELYEAAAEGRFDIAPALGARDDDIITDMAQKRSEAEGEDPLKDVSAGDRVGGLCAYVSGTALFSGLCMTGELSREETLFLNMASGGLGRGQLTFPTEDGPISVSVRLKSSKTSAFFAADGRIGFTVKIELEYGVMRGEGGEAAEKLAAYIEKKLYEVSEKCRAAGSDAMKLGVSASKLFRSYAEWDAFRERGGERFLAPVFSVAVTPERN